MLLACGEAGGGPFFRVRRRIPSRALTPQIAGPIVKGSHPRGSDLPSWRAAS
jgi:hypothetical protein